MPTAIVLGAGICGLLAARSLQDAGWSVTVLEQGHAVGGRLATRLVGGQAFDHGGQFLSARDPRFAALVAEWERTGAVVEWGHGFLGDDGAVAHDGFPRYRASGGMQRLAEHLASGLTVRTSTTVTAIASAGDTVTARAADGSWCADALIATAPVAQTLALLDASGTALAPAVRRRLEGVAYAPCLCVLLEYPQATAAALPAPGGMRLTGGPIGWIASQRGKGLRTTGEGLVVHADGAWSQQHYQDDAATVIAALLPGVTATLRRACDAGSWDAPASAQLERWRYSLATSTLVEPCLAVDAAARVVLAGDAFGARPRIEGAALSGLAAAALLSGRGA
jgi:predicted NAD/FAD-dependent oxidoreductase